MSITFRAAEIAAEDLETKPLGQPSAEPLSGEIITRSKVVFTSEDSRVLCGTWECEPGTSRWEFLERGEFIHVLSGSMTVTRDGEEPVQLAAGASAVFPIGWCGTWTVHETLRKVFTVYRP
ncbi:MAG: cupin domain-containing protein [Actinomycetota bacterium]|nr:cupin domain-containing protein [Actinomycetota bacterium]